MEQYSELIHKALRERHEHLLGTISDVAPIMWQHGALARLQPGEVIDKLLYNNNSTISFGYTGIYETVQRLIGESHRSEKGIKLAKEILQFMNDKCAKWRANENISYSLYGTPMESVTYKFAKALQRDFGIIPEVTDHIYITNSFHTCVREEINAFDKLDFETQFQKLSPGGSIIYCEIPNMTENIPAVLALLKHMYETTLYAELNTRSDHCDNCGFDGEITTVKDDSGKLIWKCPKCGCTDRTKMSIPRRVCGYISTNEFNQGRHSEIDSRVLHL